MISPQHRTRTFLKLHPVMIVVTSDKGNVTLIIYRQEYNEKCLPTNIIQNFEVIQRPTVSWRLIQSSLLLKGNISTKLLPNIKWLHKHLVAMRFIVAPIIAPHSYLFRLLTDILTKSYNSSNQFYVKDSFLFSISK